MQQNTTNTTKSTNVQSFTETIKTKKDKKAESVITDLTVIIDVEPGTILEYAKRSIKIDVQRLLRTLSEIPKTYTVKLTDLESAKRHPKSDVEKVFDLVGKIDPNKLSESEKVKFDNLLKLINS